MGDSDKRRFPRFEVRNVRGRFLYNLDVHILNLSVAGMAVETTSSLSVGRRYSFTIEHEDEVVTLEGRVAWSVLGHTRRRVGGESVPVYRAGIQFQEVLTEKAERLQELIEDTVAIDVNPRLFGRFRIGPETLARVDTEVPFEVVKISRSGMLVETHLVADVETRFPLELELGDESLVCEGRVAWASPPEEDEAKPRKARLGLEFCDLDPAGRRILDAFVEERLRGDRPPPTVS